MTMRFARWISKARIQTLFHGNHGYVNAPQRYVILTLTVLFVLFVAILTCDSSCSRSYLVVRTRIISMNCYDESVKRSAATSREENPKVGVHIFVARAWPRLCLSVRMYKLYSILTDFCKILHWRILLSCVRNTAVQVKIAGKKWTPYVTTSTRIYAHLSTYSSH